MNGAATSEKALLDFPTATNAASWQVVNDDVMGGVSASAFSVTNGVAVFRGEASQEKTRGSQSLAIKKVGATS